MSGLGRGEDTTNIIEEDRKRKASADANSENNAPAAPVSTLSDDSPSHGHQADLLHQLIVAAVNLPDLLVAPLSRLTVVGFVGLTLLVLAVFSVVFVELCFKVFASVAALVLGFPPPNGSSGYNTVPWCGCQ
uniref:Transmembrane protein n=1 Tax=Ditylenchus dipsaci TaxID=166011 RepID=A0A915CY89_9BILA